VTSRSVLELVDGLPVARRRLVQDAALGLVLAVIGVVSVLPYRAQLHPLWLALLLVAAQGVLLTWRRRFPVTAYLLIGVARVSYDQIGFQYAPFPLGPAIALYTVFELSPCFWRWASGIGTVAGVSVSLSVPGRDEPYQALYQGAIFLTAATAGLLSRTTRAHLAAAHGRAELAEAELDRRVADEAAAERTRIARELHDVVAHHVSLMAVQSEAAASLLPDKPDQAQRPVQVIGETARAALTELRRLLGVLRGPSERLQTAPAASLADLGAVLDQVREAGLPVEFETVGAPFPVAPGVDLAAYRIVQEALTNTMRHSQAAQAKVTVRFEQGFITVTVTEAGRRYGAMPKHGPGAGLGLAGIAERVASCGGNLSLGPTPGGGFSVAARLPV
jgi:signal transduction histidine kinase